jgi:hypothetical protein
LPVRSHLDMVNDIRPSSEVCEVCVAAPPLPGKRAA